MIEPHLTSRTKMVIVNSPCNPSGAVMDRGRVRKALQADLRARHLPADRRVLLQVPLRQRAVFRRVAARRQRVGAGGGIAFQDLRHDGLAHRLRPGARAHRDRHDQAAEPLDVEPLFHLPKGRGGSAERSAGFRGRHAGRIPPPPRFCNPAPARHSRRDMRRAAGRVLRLSQRVGGARQERHPDLARTFGAAAGGGARGRGPRRGVRHRSATSASPTPLP